MELKLSLDAGVSLAVEAGADLFIAEPSVSLATIIDGYPDNGYSLSLTPREASELGAALIASAIESDMKAAEAAQAVPA